MNAFLETIEEMTVEAELLQNDQDQQHVVEVYA